MKSSIFASEIRKTGFVLENQVAQELRKHGWTVISNKYYVDDSEETIREIDLVAYKVSKVQHLDVYTALIISCKKSESNAWALLARDINLKDPNSDWWPLHTWSNDKALSHQLTETGAPKRYHEELNAMGVNEVLSVPTVEVFAFQEMDKVTGKAQNDKPIFSAVTSLMKAQAYELSTLPNRKKAPAVYQFNLLSVVDADLIRLMFRGEKIESSELDTEHYLARYIVRKREAFSRIRFIKATAFSSSLIDYGRLHTANCKWMDKECNAFYKDIFRNQEKISQLLENFNRLVQWYISLQLLHETNMSSDIGKPSLNWDAENKKVWIGLTPKDDVIDFLNHNEKVNIHVAGALKQVFRYEGSFYFSDDIPF